MESANLGTYLPRYPDSNIPEVKFTVENPKMQVPVLIFLLFPTMKQGAVHFPFIQVKSRGNNDVSLPT